MKKLFLGLCLIVGSSSCVFANTIDIKNDEDHKEDQKESLRANCYMQVIVNHETVCGVYLYSSASPKYSVNCREEQAEGTTSTYYETRTEPGWNPGSDPATPSSCN